MAAGSRFHVPADGGPVWAGMADLVLVLPSGRELELPYLGEPPHGDSFHSLTIDGAPLPGYLWGSHFVSTADSRYLAGDWMAERFERKTIVIDISARRYLVLPKRVPGLRFDGWTLLGDGQRQIEGFEIEDSQGWMAF